MCAAPGACDVLDDGADREHAVIGAPIEHVRAAAPQILLRLGWAPMSATPVPPTGRRPLADTVDDLDEPVG